MVLVVYSGRGCWDVSHPELLRQIERTGSGTDVERTDVEITMQCSVMAAASNFTYFLLDYKVFPS